MGRPALRFVALVALLGAGGIVAVPAGPLAAKDKTPEASPVEKDFLAAYGSEDGAERGRAVDALLAAPDPLKFALVSTKVIPKEKRADVLARGVEVLARVKDEKVVAQIAAASRTGPADQRCLYLESLASMPASTDAHNALLAAMKDPKEPWVRAMAAYGLGEHRAMDALDPLLAALDDRMWQVHAAALAAIPRLTDKEVLSSKAVPKLVDYLEGSTGRMQDDCASALKRITGKNLGKDVPAWRRFIAGGPAAADPPKEAPAGGAAPAPGTPTGGAYGEQQSVKPHFYGIDIVSKRFVIVLDRSLSMVDPIKIDKERLRRETSRRKAAVTGADKPKEKGEDGANPDDVGYDIPWWRIKTRLDLARYQTINLISRLEPDQNFELILFDTKVEPWMNKMVPANQANKQKAIQLVEALKPDGETNTWGALAAAFEMSAAATRTGGAAPDEIYFVTDGAPSKGDIIDGNQIHEAVVQLAKVHQMRVHVIGIGVNLTFLRKIAVATGGQAKFFE
jgi:hypothetical protein